jgi:two-component system response regulator DesR
MSDDPRPIGVLCVDDNPLVAEAVAAKLRLEGGFEWMGHLAAADDLAATVLQRRPSIVLLDIDMPGLDPFDAMHDLLECCAECRVIVFSGLVTQELLERAIRSGAWGYVSKSDGEEAMIDSIRLVALGEFALSPEVRALCERG